MVLIHEFEAQIVSYNHALQCRIGAIARQILPPCQSPTAWAGSGSISISGDPSGHAGACRRVVVADPERVAIPDGRVVAATYARSFDCGPQIENSVQHVENPWAMDLRSRNWTGTRMS